MKHTIGTIICLLCFCIAHSQISEKFSDGNLSSNPSWEGDTLDFKINQDEILQLNASNAGRSLIYTPITQTDSLQWELFLELDFAPSLSNQIQIYLLHEGNDFILGDGIYLEIGTTGSMDGIKVIHKINGNDSLLQEIYPGDFASSFAGTVKVQYHADGEWKLSFELDNNNSLPDMIFQYLIPNFPNPHFGISCKYTSTRIDKFYFDNIIIDRIMPDTVGPIIQEWTIHDSVSIDLIFNEAISDGVDSEAIFLLNGNEAPFLQMKSDEDPKVIHLIFEQSFASQNQLDIQNLKDETGNISSTSIDFNYLNIQEALVYELLINEIMADPIPNLVLPEREYIELYNASQKYFDLQNYTLHKEETSYLLPAYIIPPQTYLILCKSEDMEAFEPYGKTLGLDRFPSLRNAGDHLSIKNQTDQVIHQIDYLVDWHSESFFENGGWSLELINPKNICFQRQNWSSSESNLQGTPGRQNAVFDSTKVQRPHLEKVTPSVTSLAMHFDGEVQEPQIQDFKIEPTIGITSLHSFENTSQTIDLADTLETSKIYQLITSNLKDCLGGPLMSDTLTFGLPEEIVFEDLIINEVLFDPISGGEDYIELYNRSNKILAIDQLMILNEQHGRFEFLETDRLIHPKEYLLISEDTNGLSNIYPVHNSITFLENPLPSMDNENGQLIIYKRNADSLALIDSFSYDQSMHSLFLDEVDGVSLERIHPDQTYWQSAASSTNYGTPGLPNSQLVLPLNPGLEVFIENEVFSPDADGFKDFCRLHLNLSSPKLCTIKIFDEWGSLQGLLLEQAWLGGETEVIWDGRLNNKSASLGIYILSIELIDEDANEDRVQMPVVVAYPLE